MLPLVVTLCLSLVRSSTPQILDRETEYSEIRISFQPVLGSFSEAHEEELALRIIPAVQSFYSSALKTKRLTKPLKPSIDTCGNTPVPQEHRAAGLESDVIIYLSGQAIPVPALGRSCEQEGGTFKRPLVGYIHIEINNFFYLFEQLQIQYMIRETGHVLAFDSKLFADFVLPTGEKYSQSQYSTLINYPNRGKTVKTIAFPKMLEKARLNFNCDIQGLEMEDNFEEEGLENEAFFWDARIMTHDILSAIMSDEVVFSEISLALFEDSGWYLANFDYSQKLKWGFKAGCKWFEEKCIKEQKAQLEGFCDDSSDLMKCDVFGLGYGNCEIGFNENISPHERYFTDPVLGGQEAFDYCPTIEVTSSNRCRSTESFSKTLYGEQKHINSRCFINSLIKTDSSSPARSVQGGCYYVESCTSQEVVIRISDQTISCPYGSKITVSGFSGYLHCPHSPLFCSNLPCKNMCSGKGKCVEGLCKCLARWAGDDCSVDCGVTCQTCTEDRKCLKCADGFFMVSGNCIPCAQDCRTCEVLSNKCTGCFKGFELVQGSCKRNCIENCASCDSPCTRCDDGFYLAQGSCKACSGNCRKCKESAEGCLECFEGLVLVAGKCKLPCPVGCTECIYPCPSCLVGYYLRDGECGFCDNLCATCSSSPSFCTSCWPGFVLNGHTCTQACKEHCLTCDDPCSKCEDGYFASNGECKPCSSSCQTCSELASLCTSCKTGLKLVGASCESECIENCETCKFPCVKCNQGYYVDQGQCPKCNENCLTCNIYGTRCDSCFEGFGLIYSTCVKGCMDHCPSCDSPCTVCEQHYYLHNGVCIECDTACNNCNGLGPDHCIECATGYHNEKGVCKGDCQEHCKSCDEPCSECETGYFIYQQGCQKCEPTCATCELKYDKCTSCLQGFGLVENKCNKGCTDYCTSCDSPCTKCQDGYISVSGVCKECKGNCKTCDKSPETCLTCKFGFALQGTQCINSCIDHCTTCNFPCSICSPGYVSLNGVCIACPEGCSTCSSDLKECYSCEDDYEYAHRTCIKICLPFCKSCDEPCSVCQSGYLSEFGKCVQCEYPCTSCIDSTHKCTSCPSLYELSDFSCHSNCLEHCKSCDSPCSTCEEGFLVFKGMCEKCHFSCRTCDSAPDLCTSCGQGKKLLNNKCVTDCDTNCLDCSIPCRVCKPGYSIKSSKCAPCPNYLSEKSVKTEFIHDFTGLSLTFELPILDRQNICEVYFKVTALALLGKGTMCNWDQANRLIVIFGKNPEYNMKVLEMFPIAAYGSNCLSTPKDFTITLTTSAIPLPVISIVAPNYYALGCENEVLVIELITEEDFFDFTVLTEPKIKSIEDLAQSYKGRKILYFPDDKLRPANLNVTFTSTNFLGRTSSISKIVVITEEKKLSVSIDAGSHIRITTGQTVSIRGVLPQTRCIDHEKITYNWVAIEPSASAYYSETVEVLKASKLSHVLLIKAGSLKATRSYVFRFEVFDKQSGGFSDIQVDVVDSPLIAILSHSDSTVDIKEKFILSAKSRYDPGDLSSVLSYEWECMETSRPCLDVSGSSLLDDLTNSEIEIGAYRMSPGTVYAFTVRVSQGKRIESLSVLITAVDAQGSILIPTVSSSVNGQAKFSVFPGFHNLSPDFTFKWAQVSGPALNPASKSNIPYIVFWQNSMVKGHSYVFRLKASLGNSTVYSDLRWTVDMGPKCLDLDAIVVGNTVTLAINCYDEDYADFPLTYTYGIVKDNLNNLIPLKVVHSSYTTFKLNPGDWLLYVHVCDSLQNCNWKTASAVVKGRRLEETEDLSKYKVEKVFPDNIPLAIFNSLDKFNKENFLEAFEDLRVYIKSQELDLIHLKMTIEALEILTKSDRAHFYSVHQEEIVKFLIDIVKELDYIDSEAMIYVTRLFSEHSVNNYRLVSDLISKFSEKYAFNMPPGESIGVIDKISLLRHRFIGHDIKEVYELGSVKVSNVVLEGDPHKIYDLLIIVYPNSPSSIVDINYFHVGSYNNFNIKFEAAVKEVQIDLLQPFTIYFTLDHPGEFSCVQLKGPKWVDEGCKLRNSSETSALMTSWHVSTFKVVNSSSTKRGYFSLVTELVLLFLTIFTVAFFCISDKTRSQLLSGHFEMDSPRSEGKEMEANEDSPTKLPPKFQKSPEILFHPSFNMFVQQGADRRPASALYLSSVLFAEFLSIGGMFNNKFNEIFDADGKFVGFSKAQITTGCVGLLFAQFLSIGVTCLNQANDLSYTKRYLGMAVSTLVIVFGSGIGIVFSLTYPAIYSMYWTFTFGLAALIELLVVQSVLWLVVYKTNKRNVEANLTLSSRNIRVFTSEN